MPASPDLAEPLCRPRTASKFCVEKQISVNGFHVDIRHFSWDHDRSDSFEADAFYIDYSLGPRAQEAHFIHPEPPGETVFLPKGARFRAQCAPSAHRLLCLTFDNNLAMELFEADELTRALSPCLNLRAPFVRPALTRLAAEMQNPGFAQDILVETTALSLVVELCRHFRTRRLPEAGQGGMADWRLNRLKDHIGHGLGGPLSLASLAAACGISPRHLNRTFKASTGITLSAYIADARIAEAKRQLARNRAPIKTIASQCGFQTASAFSASFHKNTGLTPKQFRERHVPD